MSLFHKLKISLKKRKAKRDAVRDILKQSRQFEYTFRDIFSHYPKIHPHKFYFKYASSYGGNKIYFLFSDVDGVFRLASCDPLRNIHIKKGREIHDFLSKNLEMRKDIISECGGSFPSAREQLTFGGF